MTLNHTAMWLRTVFVVWVSVLGVARGNNRVAHTPDGVIVTPDSGAAKRVRLQVLSDRIIHVTAVPLSDLPAPASLMVNLRPDAPAQFKTHEQDGYLEVRTDLLIAKVSLANGSVSFENAHGTGRLVGRDSGAFQPVNITGKQFYAIEQQFNPGTDEAFYGLGQHQNGQMNYNGQDVELAQHNTEVAIPFVVSSRNYGVLWDNNSITRFGDPQPYSLASRDLEVVDANGSPGGFTAKYYVGDQLVLTRVEPDINYQYIKDQANRPREMLGSTMSSAWAQPLDIANARITWEGSLRSKTAGVHRFKLFVSSYFKLFVDDKLVTSGWRQNWNPSYHNFDVPLAAGKPVRVRLEWTPDDGFVALLHEIPLSEAARHSLWLSSEAASAIDYYYIGGTSLDEIIAGYRRLTGKAVMLPRWAYGFWQSRQRYETQAQVLDIAQQYRKRHIPLDNIVQDYFYWREDDWGSHRFDPTRFPNPKDMIRQLHEEHLHFMISVWPKFYPTTANYRELDKDGFIYRRNIQLGVRDWVGPKGYLNAFYDPYSAKARQVYWQQIRDNLDVLGVDGWWLDASEPETHIDTDIEELKRRMSPTALGPGAAFFNSYPLLHTTGVYEGSRASHPDVRPFILTRSAFAGEQRNGSAVWSGDTASRWPELRNQISAGMNFSLSGIPNWTFDIGGFALEARYLNPSEADLAEWRELNLRWFQFGALAPLFRSHGERPFREIFNLAPEGSDVYNSLVWYDQLRYRLLPYIYTLAADTYHRDGSIMRALVMDFPKDVQTRNIDDEYLLGSALLVSPVYEYGARVRSVYLPAGNRWYDFYDGTAYEGGVRIDAPAPVDRIPLFVRAGSIIPIGPAIEYSDQKSDAPLTLYVYTGKSGRFDLYEDDGLSLGYEHGEYARIPITYEEATGRLTIGKRAGAYPGMASHRAFNVRWISGPHASTEFNAKPDVHIDFDGEPVSIVRAR